MTALAPLRERLRPAFAHLLVREALPLPERSITQSLVDHRLHPDPFGERGRGVHGARKIGATDRRRPDFRAYSGGPVCLFDAGEVKRNIDLSLELAGGVVVSLRVSPQNDVGRVQAIPSPLDTESVTVGSVRSAGSSISS